MDTTKSRFWPKVDKSGDCWMWTAAKIPTGYGRLRRSKKDDGWAYAHRVSWEIHNGPIPSGLCVLHKCDNPPCVNPEHLWLGTMADNMRDRDRKGRQARGRRMAESTGKRKLTEQQAIEILSLRPFATAREVSAMYPVSIPSIFSIWGGHSWGHLTGALRAHPQTNCTAQDSSRLPVPSGDGILPADGSNRPRQGPPTDHRLVSSRPPQDEGPATAVTR